MGGGGVLRTAAKVASTKAFLPPLAGETSRRISRPTTSSFVPAIEPGVNVQTLSSAPSQNESPAASVAARWPDWECDEWEFAGDGESSFESADVVPRLVFGPVPTVEEAKAATSDLKDVLEKMYFTPDHTLGSHEGGQATTYGVNGVISAVPKHVTQMFSLLKGSSEAQEVVASLAADKNIWNAVMRNEKVVQFCMNPSPEVTQIFGDPAESVGESKTEFSSTTNEEKTSEGFFARMKARVSHAVSNVSDYLQDIFGISSPSDEKETSSSTDDKYFNTSFGRAFMGLAFAVIMIILFKRV